MVYLFATTQWLDRESNPRPIDRKSDALPLRHEAARECACVINPTVAAAASEDDGGYDEYDGYT